MRNEAARRNHIRKGAKFNIHLLTMAKNLVALGVTEFDMGVILGVGESTINKWKQRYPDFFTSCKEGKTIAKGILLAQMMRAATGYDYEEIDETFKPLYHPTTGQRLTDAAGEPLADVLVETKKKTKHQPGNAALMEFISCNLLPEDFKRNFQLEVKDNSAFKQVAELEAGIICQFAGKLMELCPKPANLVKQIESTVIDAEPSRQPGTPDAANTQGDTGKPTV